MRPVFDRTILTICSNNYVSRALHALESHRDHNEGYNYLLVLCERPDAAVRPAADWLTTRTMFDVGVPDPEGMGLRYDIVELNTAIKPFVFRALFAEGCRAATYIDPDVSVFDKLYDVDSRESDAVVTPHMVDARPDGMFPDMHQTLKSGQFNFGYLSLRNTPNTADFLAWWADKLLTRCVKDAADGVFVDQSWGAAIVSLMDKVAIERGKGSHAAYWNLRPGDMAFLDDDFITVRGEPLIMFHFSGFDPTRPNMLSCHSRRFNPLNLASPVGALALRYAGDIRDREERMPTANLPCSMARKADGTPITAIERRVARGVGPDFREAYVRRTWQFLGRSGIGRGPARVAVYGAGKHTRWLEGVTAGCGPAPDVVVLLDDHPRDERVGFGLKPTTPESHAEHPPMWDVILTSSDIPANAARMVERARSVFGPHVCVLDLYEGCPPGQYV